jgi:plastocyanin
MLRRFIPVLAACAALAVAGCGDDDDEGGSASGSGGGGYGSAPAKSQEDTQTQAAAPAEGGITVRMKDIKFDPETVKAKVGDTITWVNEDQVEHNVVGGDFKSENFGAGAKYEYKVDEAGSITYECTLHPGMDGTIEATD